MAITTFAELKTAVADWLARDDLTAFIPDFIVLFEAQACRKLMVLPTETTAVLTPAAGSVTIPTGFLGAIALTWNGSVGGDLQYLSPSAFHQMYRTITAGQPLHYTIQAGAFKISSTDTTTLTLLYRAKTAAVSGSLNWLFTNHPDAYLFGSLAEAYMFTKDPDNAGIWKARCDAVFDEITKQNFNYRGQMAIINVEATP